MRPSSEKLYRAGKEGMAGVTRRWLRWLCSTRGAGLLPRPHIWHSDGRRRIAGGSANPLQKRSPWFLCREGLLPPRPQGFDPLHYQPSMENARRLARLVQLEDLKARLHENPRDSISYEELLRVCMDSACASSEEEARRIVRSLDEAGCILIIGRAVYLHPRQVARAIEDLMPAGMAGSHDPRREELERMEKQKEEIDAEAKRLVRRELWLGLGFMTVQTAALMRLTFWEMSWDVMEPVCFFLTTAYFLAGYAFFLATSRDPTFEGFFKTRLEARQSRLMKQRNFDLGRFRELRRMCGPGGLTYTSRGARGVLDALEDR